MPQLRQLPSPRVAGMRMIVGCSGVRAKEVSPYSFAKNLLWSERVGLGNLEDSCASSWSRRSIAYNDERLSAG